MAAIREAAVGGQFYPGTAARLQAMVTALLEAAPAASAPARSRWYRSSWGNGAWVLS